MSRDSRLWIIAQEGVERDPIKRLRVCDPQTTVGQCLRLRFQLQTEGFSTILLSGT